MKKIICFLLPFILFTQCFAKGNGENLLECEKALQAHPYVIDFKCYNSIIYEVTLTNGRTITFDEINIYGGGFYACVNHIGEYQLIGEAIYRLNPKKKWKTCSRGAYFSDLSQILGIKIETMVDVIDNYEKIIKLAQFLALEQFKAGYQESEKLSDNRCFDLQTINKFPRHYAISENRKAVIYVLAIYDYPRWVWDGIQENELKISKSQVWTNTFGENWENNIPYDKIRKSLGLE